MADEITKTLAIRITASERDFRREADKAWNEHRYDHAIRYRALADGLEIARGMLLDVILESKRAAADTTEARDA